MGFFSTSRDFSDLRAGYEGDFVADSRLKQYDEGVGRVDEYEQETQSGTVTWNFVNRVDLYGVFGTSQTTADWRFTDLGGAVHRIKAKTDTRFSWAAGARAIYYEWCGLDLGVGGRYTACDAPLASLTSDGRVASTAGGRIHWTEWQISFDMAYTIRLFTPYIGVKYSHARADLDHFVIPISQSGTGDNRFKNREPVGLYLGCALSTHDYFMANVEGRLIDEEAVTVSADFRF
jgi:opacity protein-like surface antigen